MIRLDRYLVTNLKIDAVAEACYQSPVLQIFTLGQFPLEWK